MNQKAVVVANSFNKQACIVSKKVISFLHERHIETQLVSFSGDGMVEFPSCDFAITLGGDGTVLFAARHCAKINVPIFPINFGEFGFIGGVSRDKWQQDLVAFLEKKSVFAQRNLLSVEVFRQKSSIYKGTCLNEAVVSTRTIAKILSLDVSFNENSFGKFKVDGIIVATSTGSTAYSAAAGGPIIDPDLDVFVLSPICSLSLSNRPIVLPSNGQLHIKVLPSRASQSALVLDGQLFFNLEEHDTITIKKSSEKVTLVGCTSNVFYSALRSKLQWSGGPV
ncbi:MAG: NAD(+)/NADH kinase [Treponemataceae bacterium]